MVEAQPKSAPSLALRALLPAAVLAALLLASTPATAMMFTGQTHVYCAESSGNMQCFVCTDTYGGSMPGLWNERPLLVGVQVGIPDPSHPGSYTGGSQAGVSAGECP